MRLLKKLRIDAGLSQVDIGRKCRIHPALISKIETGAMRPWPAISKKLEKIFSLPIHELMKDDTPESGDSDEA